MSVVVITPPEPGIDLELVKAHLRVEDDGDDVLIQAFIDAACAHIDGPQGWLGRAIWPQTLELRRNVFCGPIRLPYGPVSAVSSVKYVDHEGTEQTLASDTYALLNTGDLVLAHNQSWPSLRGDAEGVRIQYEAGFETTPPAVVSAILLMVGDLWTFRETAVIGTISADVQMSMTVQALLGPIRVWSV